MAVLHGAWNCIPRYQKLYTSGSFHSWDSLFTVRKQQEQKRGKVLTSVKNRTKGALGQSMVYITDYGDRWHSSLSCSGLKRSIYMIRKTKATDKRMCKKCGS